MEARVVLREGGFCREIPKNGRGAKAGGPGASNKTKKMQTRVKDTTAAHAGKQAAMHAYCLGWISAEACTALFRMNPKWRSA